jgi:hypothetical protein
MEHSWVFVNSGTRLTRFQTVRHLKTLNRGKKGYIHTLHTHTASDGLGYTLHVYTASGGKGYPACPYCWWWKGLPYMCILLVVENDTLTMTILLAVEGDTHCLSILMAVERSTPCRFILLVLLLVKGIPTACLNCR